MFPSTDSCGYVPENRRTQMTFILSSRATTDEETCQQKIK
jgi:hypothetical protein